MRERIGLHFKKNWKSFDWFIAEVQRKKMNYWTDLCLHVVQNHIFVLVSYINGSLLVLLTCDRSGSICKCLWRQEAMFISECIHISSFKKNSFTEMSEEHSSHWRSIKRKCLFSLSGRCNPLHPNISINILHTVLYTLPKRPTMRICLTIKSCSSW